MSKIRGIFPLFLATAFGIGNGIWVFGPAFKEQQQEREEKAKQLVETEQRQDEALELLRKAEADASRSAATDAALKSGAPSKSLWSGFGLWAKEKPAAKSTAPLPEVSNTSDMEDKYDHRSS